MNIEELRKVYEERFNAKAAGVYGHADACHAAGLLAVARYSAEKQRWMEPTEKMRSAYYNAQSGGALSEDGYRAMQSAAPLWVDVPVERED